MISLKRISITIWVYLLSAALFLILFFSVSPSLKTAVKRCMFPFFSDLNESCFLKLLSLRNSHVKHWRFWINNILVLLMCITGRIRFWRVTHLKRIMLICNIFCSYFEKIKIKFSIWMNVNIKSSRKLKGCFLWSFEAFCIFCLYWHIW